MFNAKRSIGYNTAKAFLTRVAVQPSATGIITTIIYDTPLSNNLNSIFTYNSGILTINKSGMYVFNFLILSPVSVAPTRDLLFKIVDNGITSTFRNPYNGAIPNIAINPIGFCIMYPINTIGATIITQVLQNSGASLNWGGSTLLCNFSIARIAD